MDAVEQKILAAVDAQRETLLAFAQDIGAHAEPGFFETRTAARVAELLRGCGLSPQTGLARTGVKAVLQGGAPGPCAAVIGELDGILCPAHPAANPENGVAHACGHNAQLTALVGAALALSAPGVAEALSGSVAFFAVPAEEYVPIGTRQALQKQGVEFCCGKSELLRTGGFDGVDLALTTHVHMIPCESDLLLGNVACNGFTSKTVVFHGKAAHAATAPHAGVNALNAAALALNAVGLLRETFRECDTVRIHTNIREGGAADLQLLGIGNNGHIAFNEASDHLIAVAHTEKLTESTINANARFFEKKEDVPTMAITMGMGDILAAKKVVLAATGLAKVPAIKGLIMDDVITTQNPSTMLKMHEDAVVVIDRELADAVGYRA